MLDVTECHTAFARSTNAPRYITATLSQICSTTVISAEIDSIRFPKGKYILRTDPYRLILGSAYAFQSTWLNQGIRNLQLGIKAGIGGVKDHLHVL